MDYLKKAEKALEYLADTEELYATFYAQQKYAPERLKASLAHLEQQSDEPTQTAKKTAALADKEYKQLVDSYEVVTKEFKEIAEKRRRAEMTIEMYRSVNSAMKRGNI